MCQIGSDGSTKDGHLSQTTLFRLGGDDVRGAESRGLPSRDGYVARGAYLRAFHPTELFEPAVIFFDRPDLTGPGLLRTVAHLQVIGGPVLRVTVWGHDPKHLVQAIAFQMHDAPVRRDRYFSQLPVPRPIGINMPVGFELRQPVPPKAADQLEVVHTAVPPIECHQAWREPPLVRGREQGLEVVVFDGASVRLS